MGVGVLRIAVRMGLMALEIFRWSARGCDGCFEAQSDAIFQAIEAREAFFGGFFFAWNYPGFAVVVMWKSDCGGIEFRQKTLEYQ